MMPTGTAISTACSRRRCSSRPTRVRRFSTPIVATIAESRRTIEELLRESDERDPVLKPGGVFDGPLWEELLAEPDELTAGARLGPYEVRSAIGAGGMGEVYRAHDTRLGRDVAIKVLPASSRQRGRAGAVRARSSRRGRAEPSEHPRDSRRRRRRRRALRGHGAARGRDAARPAGGAGRAGSGGSRELRRADRARPRGGARSGNHPPRPEAGQHLHHPRRPHQDSRLRHRDLRPGLRPDRRAAAAHENRAGDRERSATCRPSSSSDNRRPRNPTCSASAS